MGAGSVLLGAVLVFCVGDYLDHKATSVGNQNRYADSCFSYIFPIVFLREWVRMRIDVSISERPISIAKLSRQVIQPLETGVAAVRMPKGHGEHAGHDDLHTTKILCGMLWRSLINYDNVNAMSRIVIDECGEVITQVQRWFVTIEFAKGFLEGLRACG